MGCLTSISEYELGRGDGAPPPEGVDIEAETVVVAAKVVEPEKKTAARKTAAKTK
jgi:hypothetical protein